MSQHPMHASEPRPADADARGDELSDDELEAVTGGTDVGGGRPPLLLPPTDDPTVTGA